MKRLYRPYPAMLNNHRHDGPFHDSWLILLLALALVAYVAIRWV